MLGIRDRPCKDKVGLFSDRVVGVDSKHQVSNFSLLNGLAFRQIKQFVLARQPQNFHFELDPEIGLHCIDKQDWISGRSVHYVLQYVL